jgi:hypothetical protein
MKKKTLQTVTVAGFSDFFGGGRGRFRTCGLLNVREEATPTNKGFIACLLVTC